MKFKPITVSKFELPKRRVSRQRYPFNDKRLYQQWETLTKAMHVCGSVVVNQISKTVKEAAGYYRFLRNSSISIMELIHLNCKIPKEHLEGRHVLSTGDTTSYNLKTHKGRIQGPERIGVLEDNKTAGFFTHVHLGVNAQTQDIIGLPDVLLWCRPKSSKKGTPKPFEERGSHKWVEGASNSKKVLSGPAMVTHVLDSDADGFGVFEKPVAMGDHFVIRTHHNREVVWQDPNHKNAEKTSTLKDCLVEQPPLGTYEIELPALDFYSKTYGKRVQRKKRITKVEVRSCKVKSLSRFCKLLKMSRIRHF